MRSIALFLLLFAAASQAADLPIRKLDGPIVLDGDLSDAGWSSALRVDGFVEFFKGDNTPPPARTTAWLAYDSRYFYAAFRCDDPSASSIRAPFVDRDQVLPDQDYVAVMLDTANDRRAAAVFRVNARGVQGDSILSDANDNEDFAPDFFFESASAITPTGWSAELRIPLSSLHYAGGDPQAWGIILTRNYPRDFRYIMSSARLPKGRNCFVCYASSLTGLTDLPSGGHTTFAPYSTAARDEHQSGTRLAAEPVRSDIGGDFKWNASSRLIVDATLNPDFSQIESDVPQLSVNNRFALSYPEKRAFFLEGVDLLATPLRAVYTRSITAPAWGLRATGQSGQTAYTLLAAEDRGGGAVVLPGTEGSSLAAQDFRSLAIIGRVRRSLGSSFVGVLFTDREVEGGGHNRVLGPDFQWKISGSDKLTGQVLFSDTKNPTRTNLSPAFDGSSATGHAARFVYNRDTSRYDVFWQAGHYSPHFRADNGFMPWVGLRSTYAEVGGHWYPKRGFASFVRPFAGAGVETAWRGGMVGAYFEGKLGTSGWIGFHPVNQDRVQGLFTPNYQFTEVHLAASPSRLLPSIALDGSFGQRVDYTNRRMGNGGSLTWTSSVRPTVHLELAANITHEWLDVAGSPLYTADIDRLKATYVFDQRSLARLIVQRGNVDRTVAMYAKAVSPRDGDLTLSALYGYRLNWQTTFFAGYGDARLLDENEHMLPNHRSLFVKVSYAFQR